MDIHDFTFTKPTLTEPGTKYFLSQTLKQCHVVRDNFHNVVFNIERKVRSTNKNVTNENVDQYMDDYIEERDTDLEIEAEENNMNGYIDDYGDGNFDGDEVENFGEFDS